MAYASRGKLIQERKRYYQENKEYIKVKATNYYHEITKVNNKTDPTYKARLYEKNQRKKHSWNKFLLELRMSYGGACNRCKYDKEPRILQFHHTDPTNKTMDVVLTRNRRKAREEAAKCELLCPNCHAYEHLSA